MALLAKFQRSDALAATYIPLTHALRAEIAALPVFPVPPPVVPVVPGQEEPTFAQAFLAELTAAENRNLMRPIPAYRLGPTTYPAWSSYMEFLECASLMHPLYRQGNHLPDAVRRARQDRVLQQCMTLFMVTHGLSDHRARLPQEHRSNIPPQAPQPDDIARPGLSSLLSRMNAVAGASAEPESDTPAVPPPGSLTIQGHISRMGRAYFESPASRTAVSTFWNRERVFRCLSWGARAMLSHSTGNQWGERCFGHAAHALSSKKGDAGSGHY